MSRLNLSALFPLALLACSEAKDAPAEQPTPTPTVSTPTADETGETVSILRPDVEDPGEAPIEPEQLVLSFTEGTTLSEKALGELADLLDTRALKEGGAITIGGHSDAGGSDDANLRLSGQRADVVKDWLVERGVDPARITTVAFGEQNPLAPNALPDGTPNEEGRAANRRVEVLVDAPKP